MTRKDDKKVFVSFLFCLLFQQHNSGFSFSLSGSLTTVERLHGAQGCDRVVGAGQQQKYRFWNNLAYAIMKSFGFPLNISLFLSHARHGGNITTPSNPKVEGHQMRKPHTVNTSPAKENCLTVGLLEARAGTLTTELLGLASSVVGDEECAVVGNEGLLELVLAVLIDELLVVGDLEAR